MHVSENVSRVLKKPNKTQNLIDVFNLKVYGYIPRKSPLRTFRLSIIIFDKSSSIHRQSNIDVLASRGLTCAVQHVGWQNISWPARPGNSPKFWQFLLGPSLKLTFLFIEFIIPQVVVPSIFSNSVCWLNGCGAQSCKKYKLQILPFPIAFPARLYSRGVRVSLVNFYVTRKW